MIKFTREAIHLISRHSNWSEQGVDQALKKDVYNGVQEWKAFLKIAFLSLGVSFLIAGIIFFFAYNWTELHRFVKMGMIAGLLIVTTIVALVLKDNQFLSNILLTASSMLVGVLFAVFGQIYQTGANAYDFFLAWTLVIVLWVAIVNFSALWFIFIALINITLVLYWKQQANDWSFNFVCILLFIVNAFIFIAGMGLVKWYKTFDFPVWLSNIVLLTTITYSSIALCWVVFDEYESSFTLLISVATLFYIGLLFYAHKERNIFPIAVISFSLISIVTSLFMKWMNDSTALFFVALFIVGSITLVIRYIITCQKRWQHEE